jgi:hypothetical protein
VKTRDQPRHGWATVLRRLRACIVEGQPEGGYTSAFELICCDCGDHPDLDYSEVSPGLQRIRGPYPIADGLSAYDKHVKLPAAGAASLAGAGNRGWLPAMNAEFSALAFVAAWHRVVRAVPGWGGVTRGHLPPGSAVARAVGEGPPGRRTGGEGIPREPGTRAAPGPGNGPRSRTEKPTRSGLVKQVRSAWA